MENFDMNVPMGGQTVLLNDDSVGVVEKGRVGLGDVTTIILQDENGLLIKKKGIVKSILIG